MNDFIPDRLWDRTAQSSPVRRVYAIGDVHGRLDLFGRLIARIKVDQALRGQVPTRLIMLGDLIDRGPDSATLVEWCRALTEESDRFVVLKGNHEAMMADALDGDVETMAVWLKQGGRETLASWGVSGNDLDEGATSRLIRTARRAVGANTLDWMASLPLTMRQDGHLFVHAGVRPGVPLERQAEEDLLWIRKPFLESEDDHGAVVVHGHTIHEDGPDIRANRIGIDTGAFMTGRLTAFGVEAGETWFLSTGAPASAERRERSAVWA